MNMGLELYSLGRDYLLVCRPRMSSVPSMQWGSSPFLLR